MSKLLLNPFLILLGKNLSKGDFMNLKFLKVGDSLVVGKDTDPSLKAPSEWWDQKEKSIKKGNPSYDAETVKRTVGRIWADLPDAKKSEIRRRYGKHYGPAK
jgi:hypothetical protein